MLKIDAVVVLYNPNDSIIENIKTYQNVNNIYAVDNSDVKKSKIINKLKKFKNVIYIDNNGNQGIANALNIGAKLAIEDGADWLLTMDQDSRFEINGTKKLIDFVQNNKLKIGIVSPFHLTIEKKLIVNNLITEALTVMTSGNLLNLKAFIEVGDFQEKYFIDCVDSEYCLRLSKNGYKIFIINNCILYHTLGNITLHKLFRKKIFCTNHNYIRRYYITRNKLNVIFTYLRFYPIYCLIEIKIFLFDCIKIILFEQDKIIKTESIILGIKDYLLNKYGKYEYDRGDSSSIILRS